MLVARVVPREPPARAGKLQRHRRQEQQPEEQVNIEVRAQRERRQRLDRKEDEEDEPGRARQPLVPVRAHRAHPSIVPDPGQEALLSHPGFDGDFVARVSLAEGEVCHAESEEVPGRAVGACDAAGV